MYGELLRQLVLDTQQCDRKTASLSQMRSPSMLSLLLTLAKASHKLKKWLAAHVVYQKVKVSVQELTVNRQLVLDTQQCDRKTASLSQMRSPSMLSLLTRHERGGVSLRPGDGIIHSWLNRMLLPDTVGTGGDSHTRFPIGISGELLRQLVLDTQQCDRKTASLSQMRSPSMLSLLSRNLL
jgi:hypothetical protein